MRLENNESAVESRNWFRPNLINVSEAAGLLSVSARTVSRLCLERKIAATEIGGQWRIDRSALLRKYGIDEEGNIASYV